MKLKTKALAAAVAFAFAGAANAAIDLPQTDVANSGGSELVLSIWDSVNLVSETYDLFDGVNTLGWNDFDGADPAVVYSFQANSSIDLNAAGVVWSVIAADDIFNGDGANGSPNPTYGKRIMSTTSDLGTLSLSESQVETSASAAQAYMNSSNFQSTHDSTADGAHSANSGDSYWGLAMPANWQVAGASGNVAETMDFFMAANIYDVTGSGFFKTATYTGTDIIAAAGQWTLDNTGLLKYSAIPVPAAVWLLGSALIGLVGVSRRRNSDVVAA